jgi:hypothetical protein
MNKHQDEVDPYQKPEGYVAPDPQNKKGMWIFAAVLAALAIGGYLFYQAGAKDIDHMRDTNVQLCEDGYGPGGHQPVELTEHCGGY